VEFGIDTLVTHLDLIEWSAFTTWSGGDTAAFAGRNFIGGNFLWAHAEATDAKTNPHPENPALLNIVGAPLIAPIQGPQKDRQQLTGLRGFLAGAIDAQALCRKVTNGIVTTEFSMPAEGAVYLWLAVDPSAPLSADYWNGWADFINQFPAASVPHVAGGQPFLAGILCRYTRNPRNLFQPDAQVVTAVTTKLSGRDARAWAYWADAPDPSPNGIGPPTQIDWASTFDPATIPLLWRMGNIGAQPPLTGVVSQFSVDAAMPPETLLPPVTAYMLVANKWQPTIPGVINMGVSASLIDAPPNDHVTDAQIACLQTTPFPAIQSVRGETFPAANVTIVGRYVEQVDHQGKSHSVDQAEVLRINNANIGFFSVWQRGNPNTPAYFNPAGHPGTRDAQDAFFDCGTSLQQQPQTPIFFAVDFDAPDTKPARGGDPHDEEWIKTYFQEIATARDAFAQQHPDSYFLIGVYGVGGVLEWLYEQGLVSYFWQSPSSGGTGNESQHRPWYHANRWQFLGINAANPFPGGWHCIDGADPDADWGDGGSWFLTDDLNRQLMDAQYRAGFYGWGILDPP
jgi:hypothetical protein